MSAQTRRLQRMLLMVPFMTVKEGALIPELCRRFSVSKDELMADLNVLWLCGLPDYTPGRLIDFHVEGDRVFVEMADYFARPYRLTREEALAVFVTGRALVGSGAFPRKGPLSSALGKVAGALSEGEGKNTADIASRIDVEMESYSNRWRTIIEKGLKEKKTLRIEYYSFSRDEVTSREVDPHTLLFSYGHWYLLAWCHEAEDDRLFRLDRLKNVKLGSKRVEGERREFSVPALVGEYSPGKKAHQVRLRFEGPEGRRLVEEWPAAKVQEDKDSRMTVELRTRNLSWLSNYLLRFGDRVKIESPKELRRLVGEKASEMLKMYA